MKKIYKNDACILVLLIILFSVYAAVFIHRTSFVIDGEQYFSLFDDAMVSMRYAKNLAGGHGLVMNPGERVEGITNPLWTLYMAAVHILPLPQSKFSVVIQITGILLLLANLVFVRKAALLVSGGASRVAVAAMILTAFYLPLVNWTLQGMETGLQTAIVGIALWRAVAVLKGRRFCPWVYVLLGVNTLVRIDMAVPYIGIWMFLVYAVPEQRKKHLLWGAVTLALFLGGQTIARWVYYGDPLPNTYYLKMTGYPVLLRITRGFLVWWKFAWKLNVILLIGTIIVTAARYSPDRGLLATVVVMQMLYSIYVGGDAWEDVGGSNRYISIAMPAFFILFALALSDMRDAVAKALKKERGGFTGLRRFFVDNHFAVLVLIAFIQFNSNATPLSLRGMIFLDRPFHYDNNKGMVERAIMVKRITTPEAKIAVTWAGAIPYFSGLYTVDILGKTDRTIAREKMRTVDGIERFTFFLPGHMKYDYAYSVGVLKPDAVLQFWGELKESEPYIVDTYTRLVVENMFFYLRNGSPNVLWSKFMNGQGNN